jgi:D-alanine--poly(phosphoribitol) ligase subunit 1
MQKLAVDYLFETRVRNADKTAVVDADGSISFGELWESALLLAEQISRRTGPEDVPVVIDMAKSIPAVVALVAAQLAGRVYVPIDSASPPQRRRRMLDTLGPHRVLSASDDGYTLDGELLAGSGDSPVEGLEDLERRLRAGLVERTSLSPLYVIFTSGTTGTPKGVTISNAAVIDYIEWAARTYDIEGEEVIGNQAPLFFDNSVLDIYLMLARGCTLHLLGARLFMFPQDLLDYIRANAISLVFFVPSVFANLARLDALEGAELDCLKKVLFAGEAMPLGTLKYLREKLPQALLSNLYGPTEITVDAIYWIFGDEIGGLKEVPLGVPCENKHIIFVDEEGRPVTEPDTVAEICVAGIGVSLGYWNDPQRTAEVFVQNPGHDRYRDIVYRTGDLGYLSSRDGLIYMTGRKDHQIKHMGYRIEPGEIEAAINALDAVSQCCVLYDVERKEIVAFYTVGAGGELETPQSVLVQALPRYMIPRRFVPVVHMPMTANGKIDRAALRQQLGESQGAGA